MIFKNTHCINQKTKYLEIKNKKFSFIYYNLFRLSGFETQLEK